jgi:hypothetical protein
MEMLKPLKQWLIIRVDHTGWFNECANTPTSYRFLTNSEIFLACVAYLYKMNRVAVYGNDMLLIFFVVVFILRTNRWVVMKFGI